MVQFNDIPLNSASRLQLNALQQTREQIDKASERLATGRAINDVFDDPINFVSSQSLFNQADDLSRVKQGVVQSRRAIEISLSATSSLEKLLEQLDAIASTTQRELRAGEEPSFLDDEIVPIPTSALSTRINAANPVAYYRLNEETGPTAFESTGNPLTFDATYQNGVNIGQDALYENGGTFSAEFDGVNDRIAVPNSPLINESTHAQRTVELVFNADDVSGRQVLYEEGAQVNGFTIYIDDGRLRVTAEDDNGGNRFADIDISAEIEAGQTYHTAFVFDRTTQTFTGYLNGEEIGQAPVFNENFPSHSGGIGIGGVNNGVQFHDGDTTASSGFNFDGRISDVAIYNDALSQEVLLEHANSLNSRFSTNIINTEYEEIKTQLDRIVADASFRGVNLLLGDSITTEFNAAGSTSLTTEGTNFTFAGLDLERFDFDDEEDVSDVIESIRNALRRVRSFSQELITNLNILDTRENFTRSTVNLFRSAGDDLVNAKQNEQAAKLLALNSRQQVGLAVIAQGRQSLADVLV